MEGTRPMGEGLARELRRLHDQVAQIDERRAGHRDPAREEASAPATADDGPAEEARGCLEVHSGCKDSARR